MLINIKKYNEFYKDDYHNGVGSDGIQCYEYHAAVKTFVITIIIGGEFKTITKTYVELKELLENKND